VKKHRVCSLSLVTQQWLAGRTAFFVKAAVIAWAVTGALAVSESRAGNIALLHNGLSEDDQFDIVDMLAGSPRVEELFVFDATIRVPTLLELRQANAVLYVSDGFDHVRDIDDDLGDLLADYVDNGGGVLLTSFAFGSNDGDLGLQGRVVESGYSPFRVRRGQSMGGGFDPAKSVLSHPVLQGVNEFGARFTNGDLQIDVGALKIAEYGNRHPMLYENAAGNVLGLNAFPSPGTSRNMGFLGGDYEILIINALEYVYVPEPSTLVLAVLCLAGAVGLMRR
jgi:hypothetical protein